MRFADKVVIVTGAGSGIGKATAERFAAEGASVVAGEIVQERLDELVAQLKGQGAKIVGVQGNVASADDCKKLVDAAVENFGGLDVLVNNAGIMDQFQPVDELDDATWNRVLGVNLNGPMNTMRLAIPIMLEHGGGVIVNVASAAGLGGGFAGAAYTTSKHGLVGLTRSTAVMYAKRGIRCVAVCPGGVNTNIGQSIGQAPSQAGYAALGPGMATMPRAGEPVELANAILIAASSEASFLNGAIIPVDGGWLAQG
jgi:NAD(P)-dependent dehydrogenase (short-subunit alcohol dehydrogenase family)